MPRSVYAAATLSLVAWGALSFGAVYPWAFVPLFLGCAAVGTAALASHALRQYEMGYPALQSHPLSIEPRATRVALGAAGALCILLLGLARTLKHDDILAS